MGSFAGYTGEMVIPAEKREIFAMQMEKLLNYGGMMGFDEINMFGKKLELLVPYRLDPEKNFYFIYNYFEDSCWESGAFRVSDVHLFSGKVGNAEFCDVMLAAYMLYEIYTEGHGFADLNGDIVDSTCVVGWINQILGTHFSMEHRFDLWANAESHALARMEDGFDKVLSHDSVMRMIPRELRYAGCGAEFADLMYIIHGTDSLDAGEIRPGTYPADVLKCRTAVREFLDKSGVDDPLQQIWALVCLGYDERKQLAEEGELSAVAVMSLFLPARVLVYLTSEHKKLDFWKVWKQVAGEVYHDEKQKRYAPDALEAERRQAIVSPIEPVRTSEYLRQDGWFTFNDTPKELLRRPNYYLSDDDRLYWWAASSDEVTISEETDQWLQGLAGRHAEIIQSIHKEEGEPNPGDFLKEFLMLLSEIDEYYRHIYPFQSMFYEFIQHGGDVEYRAAVELLKQLAAENKDEGKIIEKVRSFTMASKNVTCNIARLRLKRYLSVLANRELRMQYFGF